MSGVLVVIPALTTWPLLHARGDNGRGARDRGTGRTSGEYKRKQQTQQSR